MLWFRCNHTHLLLLIRPRCLVRPQMKAVPSVVHGELRLSIGKLARGVQLAAVKFLARTDLGIPLVFFDPTIKRGAILNEVAGFGVGCLI
jgi:hypothetical protein